MGRKAGSRNRNYPSLTLDETFVIARAIQDEASGMAVSKLTLAQILDRSPSSSEFRELLLASRAYGLTSGGVNADQFELTPLGVEATGADEISVQRARQRAVMMIEPFSTFFKAYDGKKLPSPAAWREFLVNSAAVPADRADDCIEHLRADAQSVGLLRTLKGADYVDLTAAGTPTPSNEVDGQNGVDGDGEDDERTTFKSPESRTVPFHRRDNRRWRRKTLGLPRKCSLRTVRIGHR